MLKRSRIPRISKVLVIGSGFFIIGQAAELAHAGAEVGEGFAVLGRSADVSHLPVVNNGILRGFSLVMKGEGE